jgi:hypothetical protein
MHFSTFHFSDRERAVVLTAPIPGIQYEINFEVHVIFANTIWQETRFLHRRSSYPRLHLEQT